MLDSKTAQLPLFGEPPTQHASETGTPSTFLDNMKLPVHRWYRYSAGFSATWAAHQVAEFHNGKDTILDPFAGSATTLIAAESQGAQAVGLESHPFVARIANAKLQYRSDPLSFLQHATAVKEAAPQQHPQVDRFPELIQRIYHEEALETLAQLELSRTFLHNNTAAADLTWLALVTILRQTSHAGTAPWQYVLPEKSKAKTIAPALAFELKVRSMVDDMKAVGSIQAPHASLYQDDARTAMSIPDDSVSLVITSPPYPNNYDYADATRIEMSFFGEISGWKDLQQSVRQHLVRSCSQHVTSRSVNLDATLSHPLLEPIHDPLREVCEQLASIRDTKGGKKNYHLMVASYFLDMAKVWETLRRTCTSSSTAIFVIGDSAPYGVHVPVIDWFGKLSMSSGFSEHSYVKVRDRNIKWKNRKHRVPLEEGIFRVEG